MPLFFIGIQAKGVGGDESALNPVPFFDHDKVLILI